MRRCLHLLPRISVLLLLSLALLLSALVSVTAHAATYTAASCNESDVQAAYHSEQLSPADGDIINIPAGNCTWTSTWTLSPLNSITFQGAGAESSTDGGTSTTGIDETIINTDVQTWWQVTTASGKSYRFTGLAIYENAGYPCCSNGAWLINGSSTAVRIDHNHFVAQVSGERLVNIGGSVLGVADHNVLDDYTLINWFAIENGRNWNGDSLGTGDQSWADNSYWGSNKFFFIEDNYLNNHGSTGGYINDCSVGGRQVIRYNTFNINGSVQQHEMQGDFRGCRAGEIYQNTYLGGSGVSVGTRSGTVLVWGNTLQQVKQIVTPQQDRISGINGLFVPKGYSMCGNGDASNGFVGMVDTNGTAVTLRSGNNTFGSNIQFNSSWPNESNPYIYINGVRYTVSSVSSATGLTLTTSAGTQSTVPYYVPSVWDGNTDTTGYPCFDMPGRGKGDLLTGTFSNGNRVDSSTGTAAWPHQAVDPIYVWGNNNTWPGDSADAVVAVTRYDVFQDNRDYYQSMATYCWGPLHNACGEDPSGTTLAPGETITFTGAAGIGQGLYSAIPSTCTAGTDPATGGSAPGVGYWATDAANPQDPSHPGVLYVCTATNTWISYYTPYTYPHPLTQSASSSPDAPTNLTAIVQ